jgi:hypothetical protein
MKTDVIFNLANFNYFRVKLNSRKPLRFPYFRLSIQAES